MDAKLRAPLSELVGTYLVVLVGAAALCSTHLTEFTAGSRVLVVALAEGFALAAVVTVTSRLAPACCNPALTLALWVTREIEARRALALGAAQFGGAFLAGLSVRMLFADDVLTAARLGTPHLGPALGGGDSPLTFALMATGISIEALLTFLVTVAAYASVIDPRRPNAGGLFVGLAQAAALLVGLQLTGAAANPARWFGPGLWQLSVTTVSRPLDQHPIYWVGPVIGALAGGVFYTAVIRPTDKG